MLVREPKAWFLAALFVNTVKVLTKLHGEIRKPKQNEVKNATEQQ